MSDYRLNLDDGSDSAYAQELRVGVERLRFQPALESEYIAQHLRHVRPRVRAWFSLWLGIAALFAAAQGSRTGVVSHGFVMEGANALCALSLLWLAWGPQYERSFMPAARILVPIRGALIAVLVAEGGQQGYAEYLVILPVILIGMHVFAGLMFRTALVAASGIVIAFTVAMISIGFLSPLAFKSLGVLMVSALIASIVHRDVERTSRRSFLEGALLAERSMHDGLTGIMNRRALDEHLRRLWQQGRRDRCTVALLLIDIDHFKSFNALYGHQGGDAALRCVAQLLKSYARRPLDMVARYGGEEFVVVLYDIQMRQQVRDIAERIRLAAHQAVLPSPDNLGSPSVTISIGVAMAEPTAERTPEGLLQVADEALYQAKQQGRNRVVVSEPDQYLHSKTGPFKQLHSANDID